MSAKSPKLAAIIIRLDHSKSVAHFFKYIVLVCSNKLSITDQKYIFFIYVLSLASSWPRLKYLDIGSKNITL